MLHTDKKDGRGDTERPKAGAEMDVQHVQIWTKVAKSNTTKKEKKRMAVLSEGASGPRRREAALDEQKPFNLGRQEKSTKCSDWRRKRWIR